MPLKKLLCFIISVCLTFACTSPVFGEDDASKYVLYNVDVSDGKAAGINAEFYFMLPTEWMEMEWLETEWTEYIIVDKVKFEKNADMMDKLNFYCRSVSGRQTPQLIISLIVFDRAVWRDNFYPYDVILKTNDYVFAADMGRLDSFTLDEDRTVFEAYYNPVSTISRIRGCIVLPSGVEAEDEARVFVNGERLPSSVELIGDDGYYYMPLREMCEALGYTVEWLEDEHTIEITADNFYDSIYIEGELTRYAKNINVVIKDGRAYVTTVYIFQVLRKTFEVDLRKNVYILSKPR